MKPRLHLSLALALFCATQSQAARIYVKAGTGGSHTGTSWATAYDNLQSALTAAAAGDSIFVAAGVYKPTLIAGSGSDPRDMTFLLKSNVYLFGGFAGTETSSAGRDTAKILGANASRLSGNIGVSDSSDNVYHVVTAVDVTAHVNGFIISDGNANGSGSNTIAGKSIPRSFGGGIFNENSPNTFTRIQVENNLALAGGAGINNENKSDIAMTLSAILNNRIDGTDPGAGGGAGMRNNSSAPRISNTQFNSNKAYHCQGGGGLRNENSNASLTRVSFKANHAEDGDGGGAVYNADGSAAIYSFVDFQSNTTTNQAGGMYSDNSKAELYDVTFTNNSGDDATGAMENDGGSDVILSNVTFIGNNTPGNGGAIQNWKSSPVMDFVTFTANKAGKDGGAIYNYTDCSPVITNCTFQDNYALNNGGGIFNRRNSNPVITNCLIVRNRANNSGGGIYNTAHTGGTFPCYPILTNVTVTANEAGNTGGGGFDDGLGGPRLRNCIFSGNIAPTLADIDAPVLLLATAVAHTIIEDQYLESGSSLPVLITSDIFVDPVLKDYRLASGSPAIDMGDSNYYSPSATPDISRVTTDIRFADRLMGANVDLGAYETCSDTLTPVVGFTVSPDSLVTMGTSVTFTAAITGAAIGSPVYYWMKNGVNVFTGNPYVAVAGTSFVNDDKISVKAVYTTADVCTTADTVRSGATRMQISTGLDQVVSSASMRIMPNPNQGNFLLEAGLLKGNDYIVTVLDVTGRELYRNTFTAGNNLQSLSLGSQLQPGTYFLTVTVSDAYRKTLRFTVR